MSDYKWVQGFVGVKGDKNVLKLTLEWLHYSVSIVRTSELHPLNR